MPRVKPLRAKERTNIKLTHIWRRRDFITVSSLIEEFSLFSPSEDLLILFSIFIYWVLTISRGHGKGGGGVGSFLFHRMEAYYDGHLSDAGSNHMISNVLCF